MPRYSDEYLASAEARVSEAQKLVDNFEAKKKAAREAQALRDKQYKEQLAKSTPYNPGSTKFRPNMMKLRQL